MKRRIKRWRVVTLEYILSENCKHGCEVCRMMEQIVKNPDETCEDWVKAHPLEAMKLMGYTPTDEKLT